MFCGMHNGTAKKPLHVKVVNLRQVIAEKDQNADGDVSRSKMITFCRFSINGN